MTMAAAVNEDMQDEVTNILMTTSCYTIPHHPDPSLPRHPEPSCPILPPPPLWGDLTVMPSLGQVQKFLTFKFTQKMFFFFFLLPLNLPRQNSFTAGLKLMSLSCSSPYSFTAFMRYLSCSQPISAREQRKREIEREEGNINYWL